LGFRQGSDVDRSNWHEDEEEMTEKAEFSQPCGCALTLTGVNLNKDYTTRMPNHDYSTGQKTNQPYIQIPTVDN
jgi:hypothetical protein